MTDQPHSWLLMPVSSVSFAPSSVSQTPFPGSAWEPAPSSGWNLAACAEASKSPGLSRTHHCRQGFRSPKLTWCPSEEEIFCKKMGEVMALAGFLCIRSRLVCPWSFIGRKQLGYGWSWVFCEQEPQNKAGSKSSGLLSPLLALRDSDFNIR